MSSQIIKIIFILLLISFRTSAQNIWKDIVVTDRSSLHSVEHETLPRSFRLLEMDVEEIDNVISGRMTSERCLDIPMPYGGEECFNLEEVRIIDEELQKRRPDIKTFRARSFDNSSSRLYIIKTNNNFHLIGDSDQGTFFIDKVTQANRNLYMSYLASDEVRTPFHCGTEDHDHSSEERLGHNHKQMMAGNSWGTELRKYRLAVMFTHAHSATYGNVIADIVDRQLEFVSDMNFVCERDLSITFELAPNPENLIFTDAASDPYTGSLSTATGIINGLIGETNYEIGTVIYGGGGGVSYLGVTCGGSKAGTHGDNSHWTISHELGHNMGAGHMFNYCPGWGSNNMEPGAGNSIMSYGSTGVCGGGHQVPYGRINYFHGRSIEQMYNKLFINTNCAQNIATGNTPPVLTMPTGGFYIPMLTPFELTASATDPDGTTSFSYAWEQFDSGVGSAPWAPTTVDPLFQMFSHSSESTRTIPRIESIVGGYDLGEVLPSEARTLNFRCYARDNHGVGMGITYEELQFFVDNKGPFRVTYPNEAGIIWTVGNNATITWDKADTDLAPINSSIVDIFLSTDGGLTYPITLATNVANNGSYTITVPNNVGTQNRVKVKAADNIFFDISDEDFEIVDASAYDFTAVINDLDKSVCTANSVEYELNLTSIGSYSNNVDLSLSGLPINATLSMPTTTSPNSSVTIVISNITAVSTGFHPMILTLTEAGGGISKNLNLTLTKKENTITLLPDQAMSFDGTGHIHVLNNNNDFSFGKEINFSVECWIKTTSTAGDVSIISDKNWNSGKNKGWIIAMQSGKILLNIGDGNNRLDITTGTNLYNDGKWHHIAISINRQGNGSAQLYIDGVLMEERITYMLGDINNANDLVIGADKNNNYKYDGLVDEVRIWNKALTATEIREQMHLIMDACNDNLISCYQFNEVSGDATDAFSFHDGIVTNATRVISSAPFGPGLANTQVENNGSIPFTNDMTINYLNSAGANVTTTRIDISPYGNTGVEPTDLIQGTQYWVANRYDVLGEYQMDISFAVSTDVLASELTTPFIYKVYHREFNSATDWTLITYASAVDDVNDIITFSNIPNYGQYLITKSTKATISVYDYELIFCDLELGTGGSILSYTVAGALLTGDLTITAPIGYEVSVLPNSGFSNSLTLSPVGGTITTTLIYVKFNPNTVGDFFSSITHSSPTADDLLLDVRGSAITSSPEKAISFDGSSYIHIPKINSDFDFGTS